MSDNQLIPLSLTKDYVGHWGVWEALRELIQNAIDTPEYSVKHSYGSVKICSNGGTLPKSVLLLGKTTKRDDVNSIGSFGEGSKLAYLVLLREGATITIYNGNEIWIPKFVYSEQFGEDILQVEIETLVEKASRKWDVEITVDGLDNYEMREALDNFIQDGDREIACQSNRGKAYFKDEEKEDEGLSNVYVKGLFVGTIEGNFKFDYDFSPEYLTLDRDRNTVSGYELKSESARLLHNSGDIKLIAELAIAKFEDVSYFNDYTYSNKSYSTSEKDDLASLALQMFYERYGKDSFPVDQLENSVTKRVMFKLCSDKGMIPVEIDSALYSLLKRKIPILSGLDLIEKPVYTLVDKFIEKNRRKLYSKQLRELEELSALIKLKEGKS